MAKQDTFSELLVGLVGAIGTDLEVIERCVKESLAEVRYSSETVRLSELLRDIPTLGPFIPSPEDQRYHSHMDAGNKLREQSRRGDAVALLGIKAIQAI